METVYLDGEMPVVVWDRSDDGLALVLHEDTGRAWCVDVSRLTPLASDAADGAPEA